MKMRYVKWACFVVLGVLVAWGALVAKRRLDQHQYETYLNTPLSINQSVVFEVKQGATTTAIGEQASELGLLANSRSFIQAVEKQGASRKLRAGRYQLKVGITIEQFIGKLANGEVIVEKFTIIEGQRFADIWQLVSKDERLRNDLTEDQLIAMLNLPEAANGNPEGWFYPDTYLFDQGVKVIDLLQPSYQRMQEVLAKEWANRAEDLPYKSPYEALILASIIEKETGVRSERKLIASVFVNRLQRGIRLQTDPTVIYGMGEAFDGNLRKKDLKQDTVYNTYTRVGLPPTPIAMPSEAAINAALHPATTKYLYFVADGSGGHKFSNTLREHNNAVNRYQRKLKNK